MNEVGIALAGLVLTLLGAVAGAAIQHGVSKEKVRQLEVRMAASEGRQEIMREQLARGDAAFAELRAVFNAFKGTLDDIKADVEKLLER